MAVLVHHSDCVKWMQEYAEKHIADPDAYPRFDSCVTDPPYHLTSIVERFGGKNAAKAKVGATGAYARASKGFMGKEWDGGDIAFRAETWEAVFAILKPGAHVVAFSGTRTYHRMVCAIEDAGFEIRDQLAWCYGSGFPKSHDISKAIDKAAGAQREQVKVTNPRNPKATGGGRDGMIGATRPWIEAAMERGYHEKDGDVPVTPEAEAWRGWGTAIKPAWEPICLARKPISEKNIAANVLKHGTGAINIDGCRIGVGPGRFPANICHDSSDEVLSGFPDTASSGSVTGKEPSQLTNNVYGEFAGRPASSGIPDSGSAARFFYSAKAGPLDRIGSKHATVKPVDLMRWLVVMVTPPGGRILEPFAGSGTTGIASMAEGFGCEMLELEADHVADIERKLVYLRGEGRTAFIEHNEHKLKQLQLAAAAKSEKSGQVGLFTEGAV